MKFKIDENLPDVCSSLLNNIGYDTESVVQENIQGCSDHYLIEVCKKENRILITLDLDFSNIRAYPPGDNPGIIILRLSEQSIDTVKNAINRLVIAFDHDVPDHKLWIVDETRVRIRE